MIDRSPDVVVLTRAQEHYVSWVTDLLVYTVVLNLFDEYVDGVRIESFTISIFTAFLLKVVLVLLSRVERRARGYLEEKESTATKVLGGAIIFAIFFWEELLILQIVSFVFGDDVELGRIVEVLALVLSMMIARRLVHRAFRWFGVTGRDAA